MFDDPDSGPVVGEWDSLWQVCHISLDEKSQNMGIIGMELPKKECDPDMESRTNGILSNAGWLDGLPPRNLT